MTVWNAVIVAGGKGSRLGGASKPDLSVGGITLLERALCAVAGAQDVVLVGGPRHQTVRWTVEDPPGSGPAKALAAGLTAMAHHAPWTVVLAVDTPRAADAVPQLLAAVADAGGVDGAWFIDAEGEAQPLVAIYRTAALLDRTRDLEEGTSMRRLVAGLAMVPVPDVDGVARDLDTWGDAEFWKEQLG